MKKVILGIAIVVAIANVGNAQENTTDFREKLQFGLKAGGNYSNVYDTKGETFHADAKFGLAVGGFVAIPLGKYMGLQPEILYSQKGFKASGMILETEYKFTRTTSYVDVPLFFTLKPSEFFTIMAGPQYSYLVKRRDVFTSGGTSIDQELEFSNDNIRKNTFCFTGGGDINMKHIVLSARIGWDLLNNNGDGTSTSPRYKNVWYQITLGYRFF